MSLKHERPMTHTPEPTLAFSTGVRWPHRMPVVLTFISSNGHKAQTFWTIEDADALAHQLLHKVEMARRERLNNPPPLITP